MKKIFPLFMSLFMIFLANCGNHEGENHDTESHSSYFIQKQMMKMIINDLIKQYGEEHSFRIEKGVQQAALLWTKEDGTNKEFESFCRENFVPKGEELDKLYSSLERAYEVLWGNQIKTLIELREPVDMELGNYTKVDEILYGYDPSSHLNDDLYKNRIAFITALNFPAYSLKEKQEKGEKWTSKEWAFARMGDVFSMRVPPKVTQQYSKASSEAGMYIDNYYIYAGQLLGEDGKTHFEKDKRLITHWNLRDELKSNYALEDGLEKQQMIYSVMKRIIDQSIPEKVIDNDAYQWNPFTNKLYEDSKEVSYTPEPDTRYQHMLNLFHAAKAIDEYSTQYPTQIERSFSGNMEISQEDVEKMFVDLVSSPVVKDVAELIKKRLDRELQPFDIWYDGFKSRSSLNEADLDKKVAALYPNAEALEQDLPNMLSKLGFNEEQVNFLSAKVRVDASRGAGHAWGAEMKSEKARLRTHIGPEGMKYKGYNIATHEFGHNVEQTISLHNVDYYMLHGVPNTAFTEALAFVFQHRDLELLGIENTDTNAKHLDALDNFWSAYEIMGVSLVDMNVWKWMYEHPEANAAELKEAVITIAKDIWNQYYAPVFGMKDEPILAIYSHMIDNPLYLSAYPVGHLIEFQIEQHLEGKDFAEEVYRMYSMGRIVPQLWMKKAVGREISVEPTINATIEALKVISE